MASDRDRTAVSSLTELAESLQATSPGFAGRVRDLEKELATSMRNDQKAALAGCLQRIVALEGAGRDAGLALAALPGDAIAAMVGDPLAGWCEGAEAIGEHSVRAAQAFAVSALQVLAEDPGAADRLVAGARAVAGLAERHRTDPFVPRFATAAGAALSSRGGEVIEAWAGYVETAILGSRRTGADTIELPRVRGLSDPELASAITVAARAAKFDRLGGREIFVAAPGCLEGVARASRGAAVVLAQALVGDSERLLDALSTMGPVLRRIGEEEQAKVLDLANRIAQASRASAPRFLRSVLRVGDAVGYGPDLESFVREGLALAEVQPVAAEAFFALETRGARAFLVRHDAAVEFAEVETTLRGYLHLIEGSRPSLVGVEARGMFAPLGRNAAVVPVGKRISVFPIWEENFTLMKLQATLAILWRQEGTLDFELGRFLETEDEGGLDEFFHRFAFPEVASGLFLHLEALRVMPLLMQRFPGLAYDVRELRQRIFADDRVAEGVPPPVLVLFLALGGDLDAVAQPDHHGEAVLSLARYARSGDATVYDSASCTAKLTRMLSADEVVPMQSLEDMLAEDPMLSYLLDLEDDDSPAAPGEMGQPKPLDPESELGEGHRSDEESPGVPIDPAVLEAYLRQHPDLTVLRSEGPLDPSGLFVAGLTGGGLGDGEAEKTGESPDRLFARARLSQRSKGVHLHDEWDHRIGDYRVDWCEVHDLEVDGDSGLFFSRALSERRELLPEVRRQFQCVKPEGYRILRGLLDGEDFDLNAVVDARADLRARRDSSAKLYTARRREERDVATLFLLDMSASTDEETDPAPPSDVELDDEFDLTIRPARPRSRRIIDIQKEALVIMSQALEEIGDLYAIYGFSGHGRQQVEFFGIKSFEESLTTAVRGRIGGIEPQRSTRMGAALRQALMHFRPIAARSKHLILLSDGFPQDFDYGDDRRSNVYGLKDTAMALREAEQSGISTFCITVDRAGNDYLREMCEDKKYLVIDEIDALPLELPKIYSEATREN